MYKPEKRREDNVTVPEPNPGVTKNGPNNKRVGDLMCSGKRMGWRWSH